MANTTISPNMGLPVPVVGVDPGPDYATNVNSSLNIIDGHNHSSGSGVQINPDGIDINANLPFNSNNATSMRTVNFVAQSTPITASAPDLGCVYVSGADLWYNDESGNQIQLTSGGVPAGGGGSISGLPSGSAGVAYSGGTYTFSEATSVPGAINAGPITIGQQLAGTKTVTINASNVQSNNYQLTLPSALPGSSLSYMTLSTTGAIGYNTSASTGSGAVVLANSPTLIAPTLGIATATSITFGGTPLSIYNESLANSGAGSVFSGGGSIATGTATVVTQFVRIGKIVSYSISISGTYTITGSVFAIGIAIPSGFAPTTEQDCGLDSNTTNNWLVFAQSSGIAIKQITSGGAASTFTNNQSTPTISGTYIIY